MKGLWYALQRRWSRDSDWNAGDAMSLEVNVHPNKGTTVTEWHNGGTVVIRLGSYGQPYVNLFLGVYDPSDADGALDFLARLGRAVEDAEQAVRDARRAA
jgi:hypothetical protein